MFITFTLYSLLHTFPLTVVASIIKLNTANKTLQKNHLNLKSPHTRKSRYLHITHKGTESIRIKCLKITVMAEVGKVGNFSSQSVVSWLPCPPTFCLTNLSAMRGREECSSFLMKKTKEAHPFFTIWVSYFHICYWLHSISNRKQGLHCDLDVIK